MRHPPPSASVPQIYISHAGLCDKEQSCGYKDGWPDPAGLRQDIAGISGVGDGNITLGHAGSFISVLRVSIGSLALLAVAWECSSSMVMLEPELVPVWPFRLAWL